MNDEERLEEIQKILEDLSILAKDHVLLIEGLKDRDALNKVGIYGDMFQIQSSGGPVRAAEYVAEHGGKAVILTDWDRTGGNISAELEYQLGALDVRFDREIRKRLAILCSKYIKDVESLDSLVERLESII